MSSPEQPAFPPKVRLTYRVGIVGHRPNRLRPEDRAPLETRLGAVLDSVKKLVMEFGASHPGLFSDEAPCLRAISPLAEGTDRYFARQALRLGYELCCPFPFRKSEFEKDFKPGHSAEPGMDSVAEFNAILAEAKKKNGLVTFELDGSRGDSSAAYAAAGKVVLNQSDLLLAVWDGEGGNERGGTYETLLEALACGVPVLWIDAHQPHTSQLLLAKRDLPLGENKRCTPRHNGDPDLARVVHSVLEPPSDAPPTAGNHHGKGSDLREAYFTERWPTTNPWFVWKCFRGLVGSFRCSLPKFRVPVFSEDSMRDWPAQDGNVAEWSNSRLNRHYVWADQLGDFYADKYRSAFVSAYLLGGFAVVLALIPHLFAAAQSKEQELFLSGIEEICLLLEFFIVLVISALVYLGNRWHWHERWMSYRLLAELVRQLRFLAPLGGARPFPRPDASAVKNGNPINSWMYWHLRSIDRDAGLPEATVTGDYLRVCLGHVATVVDGQIAFHSTTAESSRRIHHRLDALCVFLFVLTAFVTVGHLVSACCQSAEHSHAFGFTFFAACLPAIGAAVAGINHQGEFARTARRSSAMVEQLTQIREQLEPMLQPTTHVRSADVTADALRAAQIMVNEVLDWRVVFLDRPLIVSS